MTTQQVVNSIDRSFSSVWRYLTGLEAQGKVMHDEYDEDGVHQVQRFHRWAAV